MDLQQFLVQFSFVSMAECRRMVIGGHVKIDGRTIRHTDLVKSVSEFARVGSSVTIGKRLKHDVREEHLPVQNV